MTRSILTSLGITPLDDGTPRHPFQPGDAAATGDRPTEINGPLTIEGPVPSGVEIRSDGDSRIFAIPSIDPCPATGGADYVVTMSNLRLTGARPDVVDSGGAILSAHSVALRSASIHDSAAAFGGGLAFLVQDPGQSLAVSNSAYNRTLAVPVTATDSVGIGTWVTVMDSTISGNRATASAGAMWIAGNVSVLIDSSTVTDNASDSGRGAGIVLTNGLTEPPLGGNSRAPSLRLSSSIVANSGGDGIDITTHPAVVPSLTLFADDSLIEWICTTCKITVQGAGNLLGVDPMLGPLLPNGGVTKTHAPFVGSPVIDAGRNLRRLTT